MPDLFLSTKLIHLLAVTAMLGATAINGVIHMQARASAPVEAAALLRAVVRINAVLMGPSLLLIPASGLTMMHLAGYGWATGWLAVSIAFSLGLILAFWVGNRAERRLHAIAAEAARQARPALPGHYRRVFARVAAPIGTGALVLSLATLVLMIFKPF